MIIPVRCYSCGKVVGNLYEPYKKLLQKDFTEAEALDSLNLQRYCCRRMVMTHIDLVDDMVPYSVPVVGSMQKLGGTPTPTPASMAAGAAFPAAPGRA